MKKYSFEYSDKKFLVKTMGISAGIFIVLLALSMWLINDETAMGFGIIASFVLPGVYFFARKGKIRRKGLALIGYGRLVFDLSGETRIISLSNIVSYRIVHYNGATLSLALKDQRKFALTSNRNFCDPEPFEQVCQDIEASIQAYLSDNSVTDGPIRKKRFLEQTWMLVFVSVLTTIVILALVYALAIGHERYGALLLSLGMSLSLWGVVIHARKSISNASP